MPSTIKTVAMRCVPPEPALAEHCRRVVAELQALSILRAARRAGRPGQAGDSGAADSREKSLDSGRGFGPHAKG